MVEGEDDEVNEWLRERRFMLGLEEPFSDESDAEQKPLDEDDDSDINKWDGDEAYDEWEADDVGGVVDEDVEEE